MLHKIRLKDRISKFSRQRILVLGDIILDRYIQGSASRLSPEAPVPVVLEERSFYTLGGAANVAHNLRRLTSGVTLVGKLGRDQEGQILKKTLRQQGITTYGIFVDHRLPTTCKTRVIAEHQQVVRIDREKVGELEDETILRKIVDFVRRTIDTHDAIILSDYGKGLITSNLINIVRDLAIAKRKIIVVDPKVEHFDYYRGVSAITPNLRETENAIRNIKMTSMLPETLKINSDRLRTSEDINYVGMALLKYLNLGSLLITLGEQGMRLFERNKPVLSIKTKAKEVYDVSGAGDTVIATFTLSLAAGATKKDAAYLANLAAGIVVGKLGAVAVSKQELLEALQNEA